MRCPLRTDMLDHSAECDPECALLMRVALYDRDGRQHGHAGICAVAVRSMGLNAAWDAEPANVMEVDV